MKFRKKESTLTFVRESGETATIGLQISFRTIGMMEEVTGKPFQQIFSEGAMGVLTIGKCLHAAMCSYQRAHSKPEPNMKFVEELFDDGLDFLVVTKALVDLINESGEVDEGDKKVVSDQDTRAAFEVSPEDSNGGAAPLAETEQPNREDFTGPAKTQMAEAVDSTSTQD